MPDTSVQEPQSPRDVWLTVALTVARDGMPVPDEVKIRPAHESLAPRVTVHYDGHLGRGHYSRPAAETLAMAEQAARILGLDEFRLHPDGIRWQWQAWDRRGWVWEVVAHTPEGTIYEPGTQPAPGPLAEQVLAALGCATGVAAPDRAHALAATAPVPPPTVRDRLAAAHAAGLLDDQDLRDYDRDAGGAR